MQNSNYRVKEFSPAQDKFFLIISIAALFISSAIILASGNLLEFTAAFLEQKIFHRSFDIEKWSGTIFSLFTFPVFAVIFFDALIFPKFTHKSKIILLLSAFFITAFFIAWCAYFKCTAWMDDDIAAEISLAKECYINRTFMPRTWEYATEYRIINNQIIAAPLFFFFDSWTLVKAITVFISSLMIPLTLYFLLTQIGIKKLWVKLFASLISFAPWTYFHWSYLQFGGYYIPHVALSFLTVGLFFSVQKDYSKMIQKKLLIAAYIVLSFLNGLAGIRYFIQFHFPLALCFVSYHLIRYFKEGGIFSIKEFLIENKQNFYSSLGMVVCAFGYIINSLVLSRFYSIGASYNVDVFSQFGNVDILQWVGAIFHILGYRDYVSYTTPAGIIDILVYGFVTIFIIFTIMKLKNFTADYKTFAVLFAVVSLILNSFINIHVSFYKGRYFLTYLFWLIPCIAIYLEEENFLGFYRYVFGAICAVVFMAGTFINYVLIISNKNDLNYEGIKNFLVKSDYELGYSVYWTGLKMQYLTDGKIEFVNFYENNIEDAEFGKWSWLVSKRCEDFNYKKDQKTIVVLENQQLTKKAQPIFENSKIVYNDEYYSVFEYENKEALLMAVSRLGENK